MSFLSGGNARRIVELIITGDSAGAVRAINAVADASEGSSARLKKQGDAMAAIGRAGLGLTAPLIGVGVVAGKMAMNFQQSMELIHTQAGASQKEVDQLRGSVLDLAAHRPQGPQQLAEGLFHIESVGLRGKRALNALKIASEGAAVGQASLADTSSTLGAAMFSGVKGTGNLQHTMGILNATVGAGNMHMDDLIGALKTGLLPSARLAGVSITSVMSALAVLSDASGDATGSGTRLATAMHYLYAPSKKARDMLGSIHLSAKDLSTEMQGPNGLLGALELLKKHLVGIPKFQQQQILNAIMPAGRGRVLETLLQQTGRYQMKQNLMNRQSNQFADDWAKQQKQAANQIRTAWSSIEASLVRLGGTILPIAATAFKIFAGAVNLFLGIFTKLPSPIRDVIGGLTVLVFAGSGVLLFLGKMVRTYGEVKKAIQDLGLVTKLQTLYTRIFGSTTVSTTAEQEAAIAPTETLTEYNTRLAASYDAITFSANAASGAIARTSEAEVAGAGAGAGAGAESGLLGAGRAGLLGEGGLLGLGASSALAAGILAPFAALLLLPHQTSNKEMKRHVHRLIKRHPHLIHKTGGHLDIAPVGAMGHELGGPIYREFGGSSGTEGTDTVPAMLSPGEYVIRAPVAQALGPAALNRLNATGTMPQQIHIEPGVTVVKINEREVAMAVTRYVQRVAARGPSGLVGGQLATNVTGPPYAQP